MTPRQIQNLLDFLGYSPGPIDGIMGGKTGLALAQFQVDYGLSPTEEMETVCKALKHAVCYGMPAREPEPAPEEDTATEQALDTGYPYFSLSEFRCKCADPECVGKTMRPTDALLRKLVDIRVRFGKPVTISSGIRCPTHNAASGGVANSYHLTGRAADINVRGIPVSQVLAYCSGLQLHYYYSIQSNGADTGYVHIDI